MFNLLEKVVLVTGGANCFGAQIVKKFLKDDAKYVAILDIDVAKGVDLENEMTTEHGEGKAKFFKCDVTKDEQLFDIFEKVKNEFGTIDLVVNNASIARDNIDMYKKEIEINFNDTKILSLLFQDGNDNIHFKSNRTYASRSRRSGWYTVINISSLAALSLLSPSVFIYAATKSAILHFSNCIGKYEYYRHTKVRVITVCFSVTDSEILSNIEGVDDIVNERLKKFVDKFHRSGFIQPPDSAAKGVVEAYNNGDSGSTWLVDNNKITNITDDILEGYKIMSKNTTLASLFP